MVSKLIFLNPLSRSLFQNRNYSGSNGKWVIGNPFLKEQKNEKKNVIIDMVILLYL